MGFITMPFSPIKMSAFTEYIVIYVAARSLIKSA